MKEIIILNLIKYFFYNLDIKIVENKKEKNKN